ncbi:MAG: aminomethyl-transferring glycine dehydrogenase [Cellulomonadaceae bacterium]
MTDFATRHIGTLAGPHPDAATMLEALGFASVDELLDAAVPAGIRATEPLRLPAPRTETEVTQALRGLAARNTVMTQMIGLGYHPTITPGVIRRNVLENPAWYTSYTPYQAEISQGRLEALLNFQTMVSDLTALPVAGASLLDEATAVAEAVLLMVRAVRGAKDPVVVLDSECLPQSIAVTRGHAEALGIRLEVVDLPVGTDGLSADPATIEAVEGNVVGVVLQAPGASGAVRDLAAVTAAAKARGALVTIAADLLSLTLLTPPGELGADVAVGSSQRFGVPLFYGGPHAAYMSVRRGLERMLPGRLVGVSVDADGAPAFRLALQTREQHIRRERATSNICTAQALLAVVASMYAVYHGPDGLRAIARQVHARAVRLARALRAAGHTVVHEHFFDTVRVAVPGAAERVRAAAEAATINVLATDADHVQISCSEITTPFHVEQVVAAVAAGVAGADDACGPAAVPTSLGAEPVPGAQGDDDAALPERLLRTSDFCTHPVFHTHRSETSMLRYLRTLADKDLALDRTMIPLGSCTMKLNATVEMEPISWPEFAELHPFVPRWQAAGYAELVAELESWLARITGYAGVSVQPNAGSQGEYAGLRAIRAYHADHHEPGAPKRDVCLIPASAHGTNAASATLAGLRVAVVATAPDGSIDVDDLRVQLEKYAARVAAVMLTYPSTHGVFEETVQEVCDLVHAAGGQVYIDGANLNALVGVARPGDFGGDVSHLNLHKTFCIPHGGGGPGVGPVAVAEHLLPYLPGDPTPAPEGTPATGPVGPVSAARYGSAGILPIPWAYVALMGADGLRAATAGAILAANYLAARLAEHFPVLYTGPRGLVAHECILDLRPITAATGVTAEDVAKRLMDYGFHAPTLAFPVPGTLMVEPTESEDLAELNRFVEAMAAIRAEIAEVEAGRWSAADSPLRGAPHTAQSLMVDDWTPAYPREQAAFGVPSLRTGKYFPPVRRIDGAYGDRNLMCSCPPIESFEDE